jgi:hypothetical protein
MQTQSETFPAIILVFYRSSKSFSFGPAKQSNSQPTKITTTLNIRPYQNPIPVIIFQGSETT